MTVKARIYGPCAGVVSRLYKLSKPLNGRFHTSADRARLSPKSQLSVVFVQIQGVGPGALHTGQVLAAYGFPVGLAVFPHMSLSCKWPLEGGANVPVEAAVSRPQTARRPGWMHGCQTHATPLRPGDGASGISRSATVAGHSVANLPGTQMRGPSLPPVAGRQR